MKNIWLLLSTLVVLASLEACQRSGRSYVPLPKDAKNPHIFVEQPNPDYFRYFAYAECESDEKVAQLFLKELGFGANEIGLTTRLPEDDLPEKIVTWWKPPTHDGTMLRSKRLGENGYAQALISHGRLYIFAAGDIRKLSH